jgi:hypothetical protein
MRNFKGTDHWEFFEFRIKIRPFYAIKEKVSWDGKFMKPVKIKSIVSVCEMMGIKKIVRNQI